ncbi:MAG: ATP-binding protein, partial [Omnitrophica WOR_2 bacterium]
AHIFERFYRGDTARDRGSGGAGLGLAIVRELVEAMGGDVAVESQVGQGSKFSFRLHLAKEAVTQG